jgi:beta-xylosidase
VAGEPFTRDWVEGPSALRVGDEFLVYFDAYRDRRYEAMRSRDLKNWEDVTSKISFPKGTKHGTAIAVGKEILDGLMKVNHQ